MDFDEWFYPMPIRPEDKSVCSMAFEAGRESVIANRETYQKVKAEGVREGMERAKAIALHTHRDREYTRTAYEAADEIQKEIDNDYPD